MWREDIASNEASVRASEYSEANHLDGVGHQMHAYEFLMYAHLQQGNDTEAARIRDLLEPLLTHLRGVPNIESDDMMMFASYFQVEFPAIYGLETSNWQSVLDIPEPSPSLASARYYRFLAQAIAAGHLRDAVAADSAAESARALYDEVAKEGTPISLEIRATQATIEAWRLFAHGDQKLALVRMSEAADLQDRTGQAEVDIPAREMYGDMLSLARRPAPAFQQYKASLRLSPKRFNGLYRAARAAETTGRKPEALALFETLLTVSDNGKSTRRVEIEHARDFIKRVRR